MRMNERLYEIVDFILNEATYGELEVVTAALKKRLRDSDKTPMGVNPEKIAREMASRINQQVGFSVDQIRETVKSLVKDIIKREAPGIPQKDLQSLLEKWVPEHSNGKSKIPSDALLTMIKQFISYSTGTMPVNEQSNLKKEIPNWHEKYWQMFSSETRQNISDFLKGRIDEVTFWKRIKKEI
ncbi:MAG: hypothetical protein DRP87_13975 [Spirochaetes bacterium]|nr:MAG: hypothetical protein DRP87_13975 [Spirochaetota bacterium]